MVVSTRRYSTYYYYKNSKETKEIFCVELCFDDDKKNDKKK